MLPLPKRAAFLHTFDYAKHIVILCNRLVINNIDIFAAVFENKCSDADRNMSTNNNLNDDAQVSINKGNLTLEQQNILNRCRHSLLKTMYTLPWYSRVYGEDKGYVRYYPFALSFIVDYFESDDKEKIAFALRQIKFALQDADWHTKAETQKKRIDKHFDFLYCSLVEEYNLIDEELLLRFIKVIYGEFNLISAWTGRAVLKQGDTVVKND